METYYYGHQSRRGIPVWHTYFTLTYDFPSMVVTHTHEYESYGSVGLKDILETNGRTDRQTDTTDRFI